jgi:hypothetical protein
VEAHETLAIRMDDAQVRGRQLLEAALKPEIRIRTRDFDLFYGAHHALKSVSLEVPANSVTATTTNHNAGDKGKSTSHPHSATADTENVIHETQDSSLVPIITPVGDRAATRASPPPS